MPPVWEGGKVYGHQHIAGHQKRLSTPQFFEGPEFTVCNIVEVYSFYRKLDLLRLCLFVINMLPHAEPHGICFITLDLGCSKRKVSSEASRALGGSLLSLIGEKEGGPGLDISIQPLSARLATVLVKLVKLCLGCQHFTSCFSPVSCSSRYCDISSFSSMLETFNTKV